MTTKNTADMTAQELRAAILDSALAQLRTSRAGRALSAIDPGEVEVLVVDLLGQVAANVANWIAMDLECRREEIAATADTVLESASVDVAPGVDSERARAILASVLS